MRLALKYRKSAGVRVTRGVHRLIQRANSARSAKQWAVAAGNYEAALRRDPGLFHIWIQLGHAHKEAGSLIQAEAAYREAAKLKPESSEPFLHIGHMYKAVDDRLKAARAFHEAVRIEPAHGEAAAELHGYVARSTKIAESAIVDLVRSSPVEESSCDSHNAAAVAKAREALSAPTLQERTDPEQRERVRSALAMLATLDLREPERLSAAGDRQALIFDISDLLDYFSGRRAPAGPQRVQIEVIENALADRQGDVQIGCFIDGCDEWLTVPLPQFRAITRLSLAGGDPDDPEWIGALQRLHVTLALAEPLTMSDGACLISLGQPWRLANHFLFVRIAKHKHHLRYAAFIHDLLPIVSPEHCPVSLVQDFLAWMVGLFEHADLLLVGSDATKLALLDVASDLGREATPKIAVVPLDANFKAPRTAQLGNQSLGRWGLTDKPFVLFVSTLESRKGHGIAFDAWLTLIDQNMSAAVPTLVCVGQDGWLNEPVRERLRQSDRLAKHVLLLSGVSDDELALLYKNCRFAIYPSLYEGWGLPVTEALSFGKPVIAADSAALRQAGGDCATYIPTGSSQALVAAVGKMMIDDMYLAACEAKVAERFRPRTWRDVARQICDEIGSVPKRGASTGAPLITPGTYYTVARGVETKVRRGIASSEIYRFGAGWANPTFRGCATRPGGGELAMGLPWAKGGIFVALHLENTLPEVCPWKLEVEGMQVADGELRPNEHRWTSFELPSLSEGTVLRMTLKGEAFGSAELRNGISAPVELASVGLRGFFICDPADVAARAALLEAIALGSSLPLDDRCACADFSVAASTDVGA